MEIKVNTRFNQDKIIQDISSEDDFFNFDHIANARAEIINLKERGVREALIKLGWTPPGENNRTDSEMLDFISPLEVDISQSKNGGACVSFHHVSYDSEPHDTAYIGTFKGADLRQAIEAAMEAEEKPEH